MKTLHRKVNIELHPATIMHVDKYARNGLFTDDRFLPLTANTLHTEVIVKLKNADETLPLSVRDKQLPLHKKQEVDIISANKCIIGYVDVKREEYYYFTNNFCKITGFNIPAFFITWVTGFVASASILIFMESDYKAIFACMLLMLTCILHITVKLILNRKIESEIDECMQAFSII